MEDVKGWDPSAGGGRPPGKFSGLLVPNWVGHFDCTLSRAGPDAFVVASGSELVDAARWAGVPRCSQKRRCGGDESEWAMIRPQRDSAPSGPGAARKKERVGNQHSQTSLDMIARDVLDHSQHPCTS
eukprot:CAMPEP_0174378292 /NCGR_PEP_ID=MMETSP0811_2-20130205/121959_1 /TAXON_ID=73025 ORGANISM="Eutreptiella gymnastica-like, Strain CCMP1594" /NCGR_SAMPLE_ID=MMETSP0811_2 /ASSEMBLY_ACC=CAM_ASM_000667 /LENGTH=126 /DNA_ID=CAMNT_0015530471 /DNA_START=938 /DNA_END=1317 /DNA_ORIENTATION=+